MLIRAVKLKSSGLPVNRVGYAENLSVFRWTEVRNPLFPPYYCKKKGFISQVAWPTIVHGLPLSMACHLQWTFRHPQLDTGPALWFQCSAMDAEELYTTARMARLSLKEQEVEKLRLAVDRMLGYFAQLSKLDVASLSPTTHALLEENRVRKDEASTPMDTEPLLNNAPQREERFIVIPNVL